MLSNRDEYLQHLPHLLLNHFRRTLLFHFEREEFREVELWLLHTHLGLCAALGNQRSLLALVRSLQSFFRIVLELLLEIIDGVEVLGNLVDA